MPNDIKKVSIEPGPPQKRSGLKALFALLRGNVSRARRELVGEPRLAAYDDAGNLVFAISGGEEMSINVDDHTEELRRAHEQQLGEMRQTIADLEKKLEVSEGVNRSIVVGGPVTVKPPPAFKKPS